MTGHVSRNGKHSWQLKFEIDRDPVSGKRRTRYASVKGTKRDAAAELVRLIAQNASGGSVDPSKQTLGEFVAKWDRDWASSNLGGKSLERYRGALKVMVLPRLGQMPIQKIKPAHLVELYSTLLREGEYAPASVVYAHAVIRRVLGHALTWGIVVTNAAASVSPPALPADEEIEIFSAEQISALLRYLDGKPLRTIVSFLLGSGARRGEALGLRWKDVDLDKGTVQIERSIEQTGGGLKIKAPKTKSGKRSVAISPWLVAELRAHRVRQNEQRLSLGLGRAPDDTTVFAQLDGSIEVPQRISDGFARATKALGIAGTLHGLRHTHVSELIGAGVDILTISRRIGHRDAVTTLRVYGHAIAGTDAKAAAIMETAFARIHGR